MPAETDLAAQPQRETIRSRIVSDCDVELCLRFGESLTSPYTNLARHLAHAVVALRFVEVRDGPSPEEEGVDRIETLDMAAVGADTISFPILIIRLISHIGASKAPVSDVLRCRLELCVEVGTAAEARRGSHFAD